MIRREALAAAAVYAVLALAFLGQGLAPGRVLSASDLLWSAAPWTASTPHGVAALGSNPELADPTTVFEPFGQYVASRVPSAPLWNPYIMAGRPLLADAQSAVLSPYSVPAYLLGFWRSLEFAALAKLFVAALGIFLFARIALGQRFAGALLSGVVFAFGLYMVAWLPWPLTSVWSLIGWLLLLVDRVARRPRPAAIAGLAVVVALQYFGGHPESSFHVLAFGAAFGAMRIVQRMRRDGGGAALAVIGALLGALVLGTALAALTLVPFVELLTHSADLGQRGGHGPLAVVPRKYLLGIWLSDYWGRATQSTLQGFEIQRAFYAGALPLVLGGAALLVRRSAERVFFAGAALVCVAVVVGQQPVALAFAHLPGFDVTYNTRLVVFYLLGVALLAGWGLDDLCAGAWAQGRATRRMWVALAALAAALVLVPLAVLVAQHDVSARLLGRALNVAWGFAKAPLGPSPDVPVVVRSASVIVWLSFVAVALALVALRLRGRLGASAFTVLAVVLVAGDLFRAGVGENPAIPIAHAVQPSTPAIRYLQAQRPARFVGVPPTTPRTSIPITPDVAMRYGLFDARGYDLPVERRYDALWRRAVSDQTQIIPPTQLAPVTSASLPALDLLGVADVVQTPSDPILRAPGLQLVYSGRDARIYANAGAMPRVAVVGAARVVSQDAAALSQVTSPGFDSRRLALVDRSVAPLPAAPSGPPAGQARILDYRPEQVMIGARTREPALLVLNDLYYPGWTATVDGHQAAVQRVDYLLRGVALGPGEHVVRMRYQPSSWRTGRIVSLLALVVLGALFAYAVAVQMSTALARYSRRS